MNTREHPAQLRAQAQETWRQIFNEELRMFESEAAWADYVRSTLTSAWDTRRQHRPPPPASRTS